MPARPPYGPAEYAKSAIGLGRKALEAKWEISPWYWRAADGAEGCALRLKKGPLRAIATWKRAAADAGRLTGWKTDVVYAWRVDVARFPTNLNITELERLIR